MNNVKLADDQDAPIPFEIVAAGIATTVALLVGLVLFGLFGRKKKVGSAILLCGATGSGKTATLYKLCTDQNVRTVTSMKPNTLKVTVKGSRVLPLTDLPGHSRVRDDVFREYAATAKAVIFLVDSSTIARDYKTVAEQLFDVLNSSHVNVGKRVPVAIACHKTDLSIARKVDEIRELLEKEIQVLRRTRAAGLASLNTKETEKVLIRTDGADFKFATDASRVQFLSTSTVSDTGLDMVRVWIAKNVN